MDEDRFAAETAPFRRELLAHCYRMVGSAHDAEDLVQETYLRAWRGYGGFDGRSSVRVWLYAIATNVCLTALRPRSVRMLPSGLSGPQQEEAPPRRAAPGAVSWLEPLPDSRIGDPAAAAVTRESVRLALVASLQHLPARQRAILLLREVLAFSAAETAEVLGTTVAAVKSGLQRARARLAEPGPGHDLLEPEDPRARALLEGYIAAFERSDPALLERVLRADATLEATPFLDWRAGRQGCVGLLAAYVLGAPGDWRLLPTTANGQPAAGVFHRGEPHGVVVLSVTATGIARVVEFGDPGLLAGFGLVSPARTPSAARS
ncbi:RNA polymerase subunit sigma-70 [Pseudonocardia ailaonensis]|uniref:RNA polymerase subunit sigma-70 n=1 Tax=Pseudonocardia ailaonensis TaxID=367279 RepID=A0ABN2MQW2_9PSEU